MVELLKYIVIGLVQGLTEFLPISSTAHLKITEILLNLPYSQTLDIFLHLGTLIAVIIYFRSSLKEYFTKYLKEIVGITVITGVVGLAIDKMSFFESPLLLAPFLFVNAILLFLCNLIMKNSKEYTTQINNSSIFTIGIMQGLSAIPSLSRSGSTIFGALLSKLSPEESFKISFIVSIPAISLAFIYELIKYIKNFNHSENISVILISIGIISSFLSGLLALKILDNFIKRRSLNLFIFYNIILGILLYLLLNSKLRI